MQNPLIKIYEPYYGIMAKVSKKEMDGLSTTIINKYTID